MSIRARLLLLTVLLTALPALWQLGRFVQERQRTVQADAARLLQVAQRRADLITDKLQGTTQLLYGLARARDLESSDRAACSAFLAKVLAAHPQYTGLLTIKPDGSLFCDSLDTGRQLDLRDRAYFKAAQVLTEGVALEPTFGRLTGIAVLQIAHPVRSAQGELQFVLLASLNLQALAEPTANLPVAGASVLLLDDRGTVLATSRTGPQAETPGASLASAPVAQFAQQRGGDTQELAAADGAAFVWARAESPALDRARLHVLAGAPRAQLVAAANRRLAQDLTLLLAVAAAVFLGVWLLVERAIRQPVERISRMAGQLASGDLAARIEPPLPRGELGTLMLELNETAQSLQRQRRDIDELGERLRQSQRLEAVGQLTGGVAHDFNNLLTVVMGNAELLTELNRDDARQRVLAEMIATAAQRGADLTQRLLAFARKQALAPKVVDLNALVAGLDPMLRRTLGEHIEIEMIRAAGLWPAQVDPGQLENALLNLCLNARDAMPRGGRLTLETANARLDADYAARNAEVVPGQYVMVAVTDTGTGIAPEHLQRVFEPFFTTKETGKGTGLGLAMVYGFVKQSAGHVSIYSEPGQGTCVKVYFPRALAAEEPGAESHGEAVPQGGRGTILLVEDDEQVRQYAATQLRFFGYTVIEAADGPTALALLQQRGPIDLLFTDVVMPGGMNGRVLADTARRHQPGLRVLYTSGYTENAIVHHGRLDEGARLLAKPYRRSELDRAVREALEGLGEGAG
jgi:signal transduction histidine kinase/CheY-like chemotaxis protein